MKNLITFTESRLQLLGPVVLDIQDFSLPAYLFLLLLLARGGKNIPTLSVFS